MNQGDLVFGSWFDFSTNSQKLSDLCLTPFFQYKRNKTAGNSLRSEMEVLQFIEMTDTPLIKDWENTDLSLWKNNTLISIKRTSELTKKASICNKLICSIFRSYHLKRFWSESVAVVLHTENNNLVKLTKIMVQKIILFNSKRLHLISKIFLKFSYQKVFLKDKKYSRKKNLHLRGCENNMSVFLMLTDK